MIEQASLVIGEGNWAVKSDSLLGYKINGGKYYPREMSVVRATTGTRINEDGLVELVPYNLLQYSEQFDNAAWDKTGVTVTANNAVSPDGFTNADLLTADGANSIHDIFQLFGGGTANSVSIFVKKGTAQYINVVTNYASTAFDYVSVVFDLDTLTSNIDQSGDLTSSSVTIEDAGNGWYRLVSNTNAAASTNLYAFYGIVDTANPTRGSRGRVTLTSSATIIVWGAQLNEGSTAKDYLPTTDRLDIARIDYSSGSGALLVEPQRTNLITYSSSFDNADWYKDNVSNSVNSVISPSGIQDADSILENTSNATHTTYNRVSMTSGQPYTQSCFFKANGRNRVIMQIFDNATQYGNGIFDLNTGVVVASSGGATIQEYENGWYRCTITGTSPATGLGYCVIGLCEDTYNVPSVFPTYAGNASKGVYAWGFQTELGSYPTSYIPTTSASVTRNADSIGKNPCTQAESAKTWFADADLSYLQINGSNSCMVLTIRGGSYEGYFRYFVNNQLHFQYTNPTSSVDIALSNAIPTNTTKRLKMAARIEDNNFAFYVNGVQIGTNVVATKATGLNILELGNYSNIAQYQLSDGINAIALWDEALTNTQLAQLTTL
jgi:hypothetical protein